MEWAEYDNIDGMILLSELSRRRIRSIQKLIRVGRNEIVVVLRVDKEKGEMPTGKVHSTITDREVRQGISIYQNDEYLLRTLSNARRSSTRAKWLRRLCAM